VIWSYTRVALERDSVTPLYALATQKRDIRVSKSRSGLCGLQADHLQDNNIFRQQIRFCISFMEFRVIPTHAHTCNVCDVTGDNLISDYRNYAFNKQLFQVPFTRLIGAAHTFFSFRNLHKPSGTIKAAHKKSLGRTSQDTVRAVSKKS
jgi:hypothetical protein